MEILKLERKKCINESTNSSEFGLEISCQRIWDGLACWPETEAGINREMVCPNYIQGFNPLAKATKTCLKNGSWLYNYEHQTFWTNYSQCITDNYVPSFEDLDAYNSTLFWKWVPVIRRISYIGYCVSLVTLLVAFIVLASFRRLRCPRNNLHMHLFASFIMRAIMALLKYHLNTSDLVSLSSSETGPGLGDTFIETWECKLITCLWQYFIMANYSWVLMEGLYLHNLVFCALMFEYNSIKLFVLLGWGLPLLFVTSWTCVRALLDNTLCWTINTKPLYFWIIRGPIITSIIVSFGLFVNLSRVIFYKLKTAASDSRKYMYRKWARSTLILVPLFGVHYMLFLGMSFAMGGHALVEIIWLLCDQTFASFQGFLVAVLYCLMNDEAHGEIKRKWQGLHIGKYPSFMASERSTPGNTFYSRTTKPSNYSIDSVSAIESYMTDTFRDKSNIARSFNRSSLHNIQLNDFSPEQPRPPIADPVDTI